MHRTILDRALRSMTLWIGVGTGGSIGLALVGTSLGSIPRPGPDNWWFTVPEGGSTLAHACFYASVAMMVAGWAGVGYHAYAGRLTVSRAWLVLALWGLPLFVGPPVFSRDIYSYIGQGLLAHHGLNPYNVAPSALGPGPVLSSIASVWHNTASPYGPLFVSLSRATATVAGGSIVAQVLAFRVMALVGVVLVMVSLPTLTRRLGNDPGLALWLAALSPLALYSFVSSAHNDALVVGLMVAGVTLATGGRLAPGLALCALAATIKLPAAAAIVFVAADQIAAAHGRRRRRVVLEAVVVPCLVVVVVTLAAGLGWTWLGPAALHVPTELRVLSTPLVSVGTFLHAVVHGLGVPLSLSPTVTVTQAVGGIVAVGGVLWLAFHAHRLDTVRVLGLALVLVVVGSPTVWPWYLMWGLAILAATTAQRSKVLAAVAALAMLAVGPGGTPMLNGGAYYVTAPLVLAGVAWLVWHRHWRAVVVGPGYAA